jgi:hypothetical protein
MTLTSVVDEVAILGDVRGYKSLEDDLREAIERIYGKVKPASITSYGSQEIWIVR